MADALLHPCDRSYAVPQLMAFLDRAELVFGRWLRQAPYLPWCGALATSPHHSKLTALPLEDQYAAIELFRGTMTRHSLIAYGHDAPTKTYTIDFSGENWWQYVPIRLADTIVVHERVPASAAAVLINRNHNYTDLYLPIDAQRERLIEAIDGKRRIADMGRASADPALARDFFQQLWRWDQVAFDASGANVALLG